MNDNEKRIAIAEACGWKRIEHEFFSEWIAPNGETHPSLSPPDYLNDLNAMNEAEEILSKDQRRQWEFTIADMFSAQGQSWFDVCHMSAGQRAEAFLKTLNIRTTHPTKGPK